MIVKRKPLFDRLKQGLEEGIAYARGERTLRTVEVPQEPPEIDGPTLAAFRAQASMSQAVFAKVLNVSTKTLQSWEQGVRRPSESAKRLIHVFSQQPEMFCQIVGVPEIRLEGVRIERSQNGRRRIVVGKRGSN
jgi:putative transcriptional regulator